MSMTFAYGYTKPYKAMFVSIGLALCVICCFLIYKYTALIPEAGLMLSIVGTTTFASTFLLFMAFMLMQPAFSFDDETISYMGRQRSIEDLRGVEITDGRLRILFTGSQSPLTLNMNAIDGAEDIAMRLRARLHGEIAPIVIG